MATTGPKTEAGRRAVAGNLPHPIKHGLRTRTWEQWATVPCHPAACPGVWEECDRRGEAEHGCPVLPELEQARLEAMVADLDPPACDSDTGEVAEPAGSHLSVAELDAVREYQRLGTIMTVCERWFARAGLLRASEREGLAFQGAMRQYLYAMVTRDRMRERHAWTRHRAEQTDLAAAILAVAVRTNDAPHAPVSAVDAEARSLPPPDDDNAHPGAPGCEHAAPDGNDEP